MKQNRMNIIRKRYLKTENNVLLNAVSVAQVTSILKSLIRPDLEAFLYIGSQKELQQTFFQVIKV